MTAERKPPRTKPTPRQRKAVSPSDPLGNAITARRTRKLVAYRARASASDLERYQRWLGVF